MPSIAGPKGFSSKKSKNDPETSASSPVGICGRQGCCYANGTLYVNAHGQGKGENNRTVALIFS